MIEYYSHNDSTIHFMTEGCFCPDGMMLFNQDSGICVDKCGKFTVFFFSFIIDMKIFSIIVNHELC